jgi:hypothetical protein
VTSRRFPPPWSIEETGACFVVKDSGGQALRPLQILKDEQDYDDRAQNDYPIGNFISRYRCFPLEPFHCLTPR